jgi:hypothetical protein
VKHEKIREKKSIHRQKDSERIMKEKKTCYEWNEVENINKKVGKKGKRAVITVRKYTKKTGKVTAKRMLERKKGKKGRKESENERMLKIKGKESRKVESYSRETKERKREGSKYTVYRDSTDSTQASRNNNRGSTGTRPHVKVYTVPMFTKQSVRVRPCTVQKQLTRINVACNSRCGCTKSINGKSYKYKKPLQVYTNESWYKNIGTFVSTVAKTSKMPESMSGQTGNTVKKKVVCMYYRKVIPIADHQYSIMDPDNVMDTDYNLQYPLLGQRKGNIISNLVSKMHNLLRGTKWYIEFSRYRE